MTQVLHHHHHNDEFLPAYTPGPGYRPSLTEHTYSLSQSGLDLRLRLLSHAGEPKASPVYYNGNCSRMAGKIELDVTKKLKAQSVSVVFRGFRRSQTGTQRSGVDDFDKAFVEVSSLVWSASGEPTLSPGTYSWPFKLSIPEHCTQKHNGEPVLLPLPPTMMTEGLPVFIMYEVLAIVRMKGILQSDASIRTLVRYIPRPLAAAPSEHRRIAYERATPIPGPDIDRHGWLSAPLPIRGLLFGQRETEISCHLSIPSPAEFARGYPIPFAISLFGADAQALDLIAHPRSISVTLERSNVFGAGPSNPSNPITSHRGQDFAALDADIVSHGTCWPMRSGTSAMAASPNFRVIQGEIPVPKNLTPSFVFPGFTLEYSVCFSITAPGLILNKKKAAPGPVVFPVRISYFPAAGPRPVSYAPNRRASLI